MLGFGHGAATGSARAPASVPLAENGERQLELHARTVESEIKYTYLPSLLERQPSPLTDPTPYRRNQVNAYPEGPQPPRRQPRGVPAGHQRPGPGHQQLERPDSYLGEDLSFRAYWQDAMKGKPGRFTASAAPAASRATITRPTARSTAAGSSAWR